MPIAAIDLPQLAQLFAPMATPAIIAAALPASAPPLDGIHGDVDKTRAWLEALDDASALALLELFAQVPVVRAALARLTANPAVPALPIKGPWHWVLDIYPTVDRTVFWQHLEDLLAAKKKRILVVLGDRQVGKTYTGETILAELPRRAKHVPIVTVHQRVDGAGSVENVVKGVLGKLGIAPGGEPSLDVQKSSDVAAKKEWWIKEMARWFVAALHANPKQQVWLALDGHAKNEAHPDLSMFCAEVAVQVARRFYDENGCRLLLIDYPEGVAGAAPPLVTVREEIKLPTESDVSAFLRSVQGSSANADAMAAAIWGRVTGVKEIDRMQTLADELSAVRP